MFICGETIRKSKDIINISFTTVVISGNQKLTGKTFSKSGLQILKCPPHYYFFKT